MTIGGLIPFARYLDLAKRPKQSAVIWDWKHISEANCHHVATERGTSALVRPDATESPTIAPGISAAIQVVAAGSRTSSHAHSFWHIYVVQGGRGKFEDGTEAGQRSISDGDIIYVPAWCDHLFINDDGDGPLVLLALQNLPAMADAGSLARSEEGKIRLVFSDTN
ncbi:cupin domain-containing protein [Methylorubrum thiocyanatum]|uniref:cupin domain-containing protein n=1 Tax=Methylorubrum thiocyanatum TaxID=47958 RepID=UPI003F808F65